MTVTGMLLATALAWNAVTPPETTVDFGMLDFEKPETLSSVHAAGSQAALSTRHHIGGDTSLSWTFQPGGTLVIDFRPWFLTDKEATNHYGAEARSILTLNVYAEHPLPGKQLRVGFGRKGVPEDDCWFDMNLDFTGWRRLWPVYSRDMQGKPHKEMNEIRFRAPADAAGTLFFDDVIPGTVTYDRYQERDRVASFIRALPHDPLALETLRPETPAAVPSSFVGHLGTVEQRLTELIHPEESRAKLRGAGFDRALRSVRKFLKDNQITRHEDGRVTGRPLLYGVLSRQYGQVPGNRELLRDFLPLRSLGTMAQLTAKLYLETRDEALRSELADIYLLLIDHLADQGYADGSSMGSRAILGYSTRELYHSFFLMRELLEKTGRRDAICRAGFWHHTVNAALLPPGEFSISADYFNIEARAALIAILLIPDTEFRQKTAYLAAFSRFISHGLHPSSGPAPFVKPDGCVYHHWGHYPSYAFGGLTGATQIRHLFAGTPWALDQQADDALKSALRSAWLYCNPYIATGLEGRVPFRRLNSNQIADCLELYRQDGDPEITTLLQGKKPEGHWSFNYGCFGLHRSGDIMVTLKGFNRHVWGSEIYQDYNRFGRYLSYGAIYILGTGTPDEEGNTPTGWDWNRIPGVTSIHRPWETLDTPSRGHEMRILPDNRINGSSNLEGRYGLFGMIITEPEKPHYDPAFHAVKSVFAFGDTLICLGSDIRSSEPGNPVETTLFQYHLGPESNRPGWFQHTTPITALPVALNKTAPVWAADFRNNAWFVLEGGPVRFERKNSVSPRHTDKKMQEGPMATCVIDHGVTPDHAGYEFIIKTGMKPDDAPAFAELLQQNKPYTVLRRDAGCHAIRDHRSGVTALVAFLPQPDFHTGPLLGIDTPGYVMFREVDGRLTLSLNTPDLAGFRRDESSANDIEDVSYPETEDADRLVTIRLKGGWRILSGAAQAIPTEDGNTAVTARFRHGIPIQLSLAPSRNIAER